MPESTLDRIDDESIARWGWAATYGWFACTTPNCSRVDIPVRVEFARTQHLVVYPKQQCIECGCQPIRVRHEDLPRLQERTDG